MLIDALSKLNFLYKGPFLSAVTLSLLLLASPVFSSELKGRCEFLNARGVEYLGALKYWEEVELNNYVETGEGNLTTIEERIDRFSLMAERYASLFISYCQNKR